MISLRGYQEEDTRHIKDNFDNGISRLLYVLPTGCGKTTVFSSLVHDYAAQGAYINVVVHRIELIEQIHQRLRSFGIEAGMIAGNLPRQPKCRVQVSSIQTLSRRNPPPADLLIIDEAHHALASTYTRLWKEYPLAKILGVTATPIRLNGEGFEEHFQIMINQRPLAWYFDNEYLVKPIHHICSYIDGADIPLKNGDYDLGVLSQLVLGKHRKDLLEAYQNHAPGRKAVVFCQNIKHSQDTTALFNENGIPAAHIDGDTPEVDRKRILRHFRSGRILVLTNVDIVSEGVDIPDIEVVILGALTKSLARYKQQVGRVLRPSQGKSLALVLDCVGMWLEHKSMAMDDYEWTLAGNPNVIRHEEHSETEETTITLAEELASNGVSPEVIPEIPLMAVTPNGELTNASDPQDVLNATLVPIDDRLRRLAVFEAYLVHANKKKHEPLWAVFEYQRYVRKQHRGLTADEISYCKRRIQEAGIQVAEGFWYYLENPQLEFDFPIQASA